MINHIKPIDETPICECGAALEQGRFRCLKCRARDRWTRRRLARHWTAARNGQSRRPANRPRGIVEAGVIWT
ncbi:hypothetical protein [Streptosporangium roseum]|uniref:Uncharacterized protein n=1 Tax=Streptosporangium roseum (strain ATCC 12428 / DSM 43021 / JCM 3005 / KCTC 9067 / NCIMB 10171 / NRRL 2505 / NI 9100) TaxID=479432 RepID=D2B4A2_STRRD|nr:hypothetical protein [Streptosporangium roseum]ACZ91336.1 hypothetical protein Sros_8696 [Streptosporangium roseum DSM 43021]